MATIDEPVARVSIISVESSVDSKGRPIMAVDRRRGDATVPPLLSTMLFDVDRASWNSGGGSPLKEDPSPSARSSRTSDMKAADGQGKNPRSIPSGDERTTHQGSKYGSLDCQGVTRVWYR